MADALRETLKLAKTQLDVLRFLTTLPEHEKTMHAAVMQKIEDALLSTDAAQGEGEAVFQIGFAWLKPEEHFPRGTLLYAAPPAKAAQPLSELRELAELYAHSSMNEAEFVRRVFDLLDEITASGEGSDKA